MSIRIRSLFRAFSGHPLYSLVMNTLTYGFGGVVQSMMAMLLLPLYTRYIGPGDYGIIGLLTISSVVLRMITTCAISNGIGRYFYFPDKENTTVDKAVWSPFLFVAALSLVVLGLASIAAPQLSNLLFGSDQYSYLIILTLATVFITNLSGIGQTILVFQEKAVMVNVINIVNVLIGIGAGLFMVAYLGRGVTGAVEATLITACIMVIPILILSVFRYKPGISWDILKKELAFSLPLVGALAAFFIIDWSDQYLIKVFLPLSEVGLYNVGYNFGLVMTIFVGGFSTAWPPYFFRKIREGEGMAMCDSVLKAYTFVGAILVILLAAGAPYLIRLFTTEAYYTAYTIVPMVALAYMLKGPYIIFLIGIQLKNKTMWQLYLEVGAAAVNIAGNFLLIPLIGREAAAVTTLLSYLIMVLGSYWMVMRINPIPNLSGRYFFISMVLLIILTTTNTFIYRLGVRPLYSSLAILGIFTAIFIPLSLKEFRGVINRLTNYIKTSMT